jgi:hypothetical protein
VFQAVVLFFFDIIYISDFPLVLYFIIHHYKKPNFVKILNVAWHYIILYYYTVHTNYYNSYVL